MAESPRFVDELGLVALPTAISCARMFVRCTLARWGVPVFTQADAVTIVGELVTLSVQETGVQDEEVRWSELDHLSRIVVRVLGFEGSVAIEVWDEATTPFVLSPTQAEQPPTGLRLVDVTAHRWGSVVGDRGRLTWGELVVYNHTESGLPVRRRHQSVEPVPLVPLVDEGLLRRVRDGLEGW